MNKTKFRKRRKKNGASRPDAGLLQTLQFVEVQ